jgi:hypothetical protein
MENIVSKKPSFVFGYYRPWKEDSNLLESYLNYVKDTSLIKYGADTIGKYIASASKDQVNAISNLEKKVCQGFSIISNQILETNSQLIEINDSLQFLNRNVDLQLEQQKLSNLLLENIADLLRIPDIEKERQRHIELGIKFFVNAKMDVDLYDDAIEELLEAYELMKQDYFVLHRIGCIYLYVEKHLDIEKGKDFLLKAAKYASVESNPIAIRLANILQKNDNNSSLDIINLLAADSYNKAAFAAYILGENENAVSHQTKALKFSPNAQNKFILSKYLIRNGNLNEAIELLANCINEDPELVIAIFREIDFISQPLVLELVEQKNKELDLKVDKLIETWTDSDPIKVESIMNQLYNLKEKPYPNKLSEFLLMSMGLERRLRMFGKKN